MRLYAILAGALFCSAVPVLKAAPETCSAADLTGAYGLLQSGSILSVGPFSSIGIATFDGAGQWTLAETVSVNGDFTKGGQGLSSAGPVNVTVSRAPNGEALISFGDVWKYFDDGANLGTGWTSSAYNDNQWMMGPGRLGYGGDG